MEGIKRIEERKMGIKMGEGEEMGRRDERKGEKSKWERNGGMEGGSKWSNERA